MFENLKTEINVKEFAKKFDLYKFAYELKIICKDSDLSGAQICCISDKLDNNGIMLIKSLAEFIKLREDNRSTPKT